VTRVERLLHAALVDAGGHVEPAADLFARVQAGIAADHRRRRLRTRLLRIGGVALVAVASVTTILMEGEPHMDWWIFELLVFAVLTAVALGLGPFIKRFGRSYAADVFRSNPSTGKSFIVLTDFAYYLIFGAYILFTTRVERPSDWSRTVGAEQVQFGFARVGGILLIIGVLHGVNLLVLPIIGRLLTLNRRLDQQMREASVRDPGPRPDEPPI
jgi:hypothetical protein